MDTIRRFALACAIMALFGSTLAGCVGGDGIGEVVDDTLEEVGWAVGDGLAATSFGEREVAFFTACDEEGVCTPTPYATDSVRGRLFSTVRIDRTTLNESGAIEDLDVASIEQTTASDGMPQWEADVSFDVVGTGTAVLEARDGDVMVDTIPIETTASGE